MDDKLKIFWNLEVLVKMSRSKNDGPSLRIEELEIEEKIKTYQAEIEEINSISEEENYDTSAEMADRNIEIITKKQIQVLRNELKEKNRELNDLKTEESLLYEKTNLLRENKNSQEKYIESMQERVGELVDIDILDRYNGLIAETTEKVNTLRDELEEESSSYNSVQEKIIELTEKIKNIEEEIAKKKGLLSETQAHLENKENYIDRTKTEKNSKKIADLENKIQKLNARLEVLRKDSKYLETKIKDVINNKESKKKAKPYLIDLINQVISVPYINVPTDNMLEEELLRATQARDSFANEIDQKTYNILEADTPEKLRIEFLTDRINKWKEQLEQYNQKIAEIDHDEQFNYERKERILSVMINSMKNDVIEFEKAYEDVPESNIGAKASIKAALDEKKEDLIEAEKIATLFRKDEAEDIANATRTIKYECDQINKNIIQANEEIQKITNRLTSKKSGLIDISTRNKDKDILKELAQIVIDIKHRRQFPETPLELVERLEEDLDINLKDSIDMDLIDSTSTLIPKDYEEYYTKNSYVIDENVDNINEEYEEQVDVEEDAETIARFQETYNRLIQTDEAETDETSEDDTTPEIIPSEDDIIEHDIDDFYNNSEYVKDHFDEPTYEEAPVEEQQIVEEIPVEEPTEGYVEEVVETPVEEPITLEMETPVETEVPEIEYQGEPTEETVAEETPVEEVVASVEEPIELIPEGAENEVPNQEFEPVYDASVPTEEQPIEIEQPVTEEVPIEEAPVEEPVYEQQENPFADINNNVTPTAEPVVEEIPIVGSSEEEFSQPIDSRPETPQTEAPVEEPVIELTSDEYAEQPAAVEETPINENVEQPEYQDIQANDEYINIAELANSEPAPETTNQDFIELTSENDAYNVLGSSLVEQPVSDMTQPIDENQINNENINTEQQNSDNIFSSENLENELDQYISSLEDQPQS